MKFNRDWLPVPGMAICCFAGQFVAADAFSAIAQVFLPGLVIRLRGGLVSWAVTEH